MILSYRAGRYGHLDTLDSKIYPLFHILDTDPGWFKNSRIVACKNSGAGGVGGGAAGVHLACRMGLNHGKGFRRNTANSTPYSYWQMNLRHIVIKTAPAHPS